MADSDKLIGIFPETGISGLLPRIEFTGKDNKTLTLQTEDNNDLHFVNASGDSLLRIATTGLISASGGNSVEWNTAYSWGDHSASGYALDSSVVKTTGNQTISGVKTFADLIYLDGSGPTTNGFSSIIFNSTGSTLFFDPEMNIGFDRTGSNLVLSNNSTGYIDFTTNNLSRLHITNDGKVGIGTTSPTTLLDVSGVITASGGDSTQWNTAYDWGDHAAIGYALDNIVVKTTGDQTVSGEKTFTDTLILSGSNTANISSIIFNGSAGSTLFFDPNWNIGFDRTGYDLSFKNEIGNIDIQTSYISRLYVDVSGNIGINNTNPQSTLDVDGNVSIFSTGLNGESLFSIEGTNGNLFSVVDSASGSLLSVNDITGLPAFEVFSDHSVVAGRFNQNDFNITASGNIGIGTATPSSKLHIFNPVSSSSISEVARFGVSGVYDGNFRIFAGSTSDRGGELRYYEGDTEYSRVNFDVNRIDFVTRGAYPINFLTNNNGTEGHNQRMTITSDGKVGIGTAAPSGKLHIYDNNPLGFDDTSFRIQNPASANNTYFDIAIGTSTGYNDNIWFKRNGNNVAGIYNNNKFFHFTDCLIKTDSQFVAESNGNAFLELLDSNNDTKIGYLSDLRFYSSYVEKMVLDVDGKLGIGTSSPQARIHAVSVSNGDELLRLQATASTGGGTRNLRIVGDGSSIDFGVYDNAGSKGTWSYLRLNREGGYVGINTGTGYPTTALDVSGVITATGGNSTNWNSAYSFVNSGGSVGGNVTIGGDFTVNGSTVIANVSAMEIEDPILTLGLASGNIITNDSYDRGVAMVTNNGTAFMGWDNSADRFVLLSSGVATNSNGNYDAGTYGDLQLNRIYGGSGNAYLWMNPGGQNRIDIDSDTAGSILNIATQQTFLNSTYLYSNTALIFPKTGTATNTATQKDSHSINLYNSMWGGSAEVQTNVSLISYASTSTNLRNRFAILTSNEDGTNNKVERLSIVSDGNVGIGITTPSHKLNVLDSIAVDSSSTSSPSMYYSNMTATAASGIGSFHMYRASTGGTPDFIGKYGFRQTSASSNDRQFQVYTTDSSNPHLVVNGLGRVGIGITGPETNLHVYGGDSGQTASNIVGLFVENNGSSNSSYVFQTATAFGKTFSITNAGKVGIGTTSPSAPLTVQLSSSTTNTIIQSSGTTPDPLLQIGTYPALDRCQLRIGAYNAQSSPNYSFASDTDTGIAGGFVANTLEFVAGGTRTAYLTQTGLAVDFTGGVNASGISSQRDSNNLFFMNSMWRTDTNTHYLDGSYLKSVASTSTAGASRLGFFIAKGISNGGGQAERLSILSDGNVGVGTNVPDAPFVVSASNPESIIWDRASTTGSVFGLYLRSTANNTTAFKKAGLVFENSSTGYSNGKLHLLNREGIDSTNATVANAARLTIQGDGNVGIGTTSPSGRLHIGGSISSSTGTQALLINPIQSSGPNWQNHSTITLEPTFLTAGSNLTNTYGIYLAPTHSGVYNTANHYSLYVNSSTLLSGTLTKNYCAVFMGGNVGIGINNPQYQVHVSGGALGIESTFYAPNIGTGEDNSVLILDSDGYVKTDEIDSRVWGSSLVDGGGATSYVARWTDSNTLSSGVLYDNNSDVGIANYTPSSRLHIKGKDATAAYSSLNVTDSGNNSLLFVRNDGKVGIGTTSPSTTLHVSGVTTLDGDLKFATITNRISWDNGTEYITRQGDNIALGTQGTNKLFVSSQGGVGIGTDSPADKLDVRVSSVFNEAGADLDFRIEGDNNQNLFFVDASTDRIGIGTSTPGGNLSVIGSASAGQVGIHINNTSTNGYSVIRLGTDSVAHSVVNIHGFNSSWSGTGAYAPNTANINNVTGAISISASNANGSIQFYTAGTGSSNERMRLDNTGNLGIGTSTPSEILHLSKNDATIKIADKTSNAGVGPRVLLASNYGGTEYTASLGFSFYANDTYLQHGRSNIGGIALRSTNGTTRLYVQDSSGNVGIGVTDPDEKLEVNGNIHLAANGTLYFGAIGTNTVLADDNALNRTYLLARNNIFDILNAAGSTWTTTLRTGIIAGGPSATNKLVLKSTTGVGTTDYISLAVGNNGGTEGIRIINNGNVGIGTTTPSYKLQVNGSFGATTKSFRIDHPSRPNYTLEYGSLESPYHGVRLTGRGKVVKGSGVVVLPDYLKDLIHDDETINIQITNIKHGKTIYVDEIDLNNDQFTVRVDRAKTLGELEFFWTFTGTRKDVDKLVVEAEK